MPSSSSSEERTRLHIAPFNSSLYSTIIAPRLQPLATGLSYHKTQTDINGGFGYVELPKLEADKLRQKLNGAVLRGAKMKVEVAKPEKRKRVIEENRIAAEEEAAAEAEEEGKPKKKKVKKSKRKDGESKGFELPEEREVKRGWTEDPKMARTTARHEKEDEDKKPAERKRKQEKSKFTAGKEVLFKTQLPEKAIGIAAEQAKKEKKDKKEKKLKDRTGRKEAVVIHEFEKNVQFPSFLRAEKTGTGKVAHEFVEGKGWVDEDGEVVEVIDVKAKREDRLAGMPQNLVKPINASDSEGEDEVKPKKKERKEKKTKEIVWGGDDDEAKEEDAKKKEELARIDRLLDDEGSESEENIKDAASEPDSDEEDVEAGAEAVIESDQSDQAEQVEDEDMIDAEEAQSSDDEGETVIEKTPASHESAKADETMAVDSPKQPSDKSEESSDESEEEEDEESSDDDDASEVSESTPRPAAPTVSTPTPEEDLPQKEIHPLEALYKRPKSNNTPNKPTPIKTGFSFGFGGDNDNDSDDNGSIMDTREGGPQTPYSNYDSRGRRSRSAAPTPDTAAIGKRFSFSLGRGEGGYDGYDEEEEEYYDDDMAAINEPAYVPSARNNNQYNNSWEDQQQQQKQAGYDSKDAAGAKEKKGPPPADLTDAKDGEESGFAKWFWENRGDSNRGWKKRRREVLKVGRQRENRRVGRKVV